MPRTQDQHSAGTQLPPLAPDAFDVGSTPDSLERLAAAAAACGDVFRIHAPGRGSDTWIVNNPADIKRVLVTNHRNYTKGVGLDRVKILLGNGIMTSEGELWRRQRRMIQPLFHRRVTEAFGPLIERCVDARIERWAEIVARDEPVDITEEMSALTLDIILRAIFGADLEWLAARMGGNPFAIVTEHAARDLQFAYRFRSLARLVGELAARRRAEGSEQADFLGMLIAARDKENGEPMAERELVDEVMTLVVAGHETSASALNWTWYLLATHPAAQARLHEELDAMPERTGLTFGDSEGLRYAQAVLKEAMRLYPPGWLLTRRTIGPDVFSGHAVPAGTDVMLSPYLIQRHPAYWPEPEAFRPERFIEASIDPRDQWIYVPFAAGPRHCVGENFAMYEMTVHVSKVARRWRLEYIDDGPIGIEAAINLRTRRGLRMRLKPRH
ncbi:MAG TPA: cytochrome P450 [Steroidobacteraceae bacterium]|nr:cytochrome P450 [Steroidobacteraceae bacterium]